MHKRLKFIINTRPFIFFVYYLVRIYSMTFRLKVENQEQWMALLNSERPLILCTWHQQFFSAISYFKSYSKYNPGLMISQSRDGDLISGVANKTGWHTPRGSSTRGGKQAMDAMIDHIRTHGFGAHVLDGPTGPIGKVKPGIIKMALETNAMIVPFYTKADQAWFFNSWDRFMLPKPFSRVTISFLDPVALNPEEGRSCKPDFDALRLGLEQRMLPGLHI